MLLLVSGRCATAKDRSWTAGSPPCRNLSTRGSSFALSLSHILYIEDKRNRSLSWLLVRGLQCRSRTRLRRKSNADSGRFKHGTKLQLWPRADARRSSRLPGQSRTGIEYTRLETSWGNAAKTKMQPSPSSECGVEGLLDSMHSTLPSYSRGKKWWYVKETASDINAKTIANANVFPLSV